MPLSKENLKCVLNNFGWRQQQLAWEEGDFSESFIEHDLPAKSIHLFDGTKGNTDYSQIVPVSSWVKPEDLPDVPGGFSPLTSFCHASGFL